MNLRRTIILSLICMLGWGAALASPTDYKQEAEYISLRENMSHAFNADDSAGFAVAVKKLEDYLLERGDLHNYYTQRCNEIVFLMNRSKIFEAYKLARQLSQELRERKLDKEMYMAHNMLGHIYRYCGNKEAAKRSFYEVLDRMERAGYRESMPPIYMNLANVLMEDTPEEALQLIEKALEVAKEASPERVFGIEVRRTEAYYNLGDTAKFLEGYEQYRNGKAEGLSAVNGRALEIHYLAFLGKIDEASAMAAKELGDDRYGTMANIYKNAGRWKEAYECLEREYQEKDSVNSVILTNSMEGIRDELRLYDTERQAAKSKFLALSAITLLLLLLIVAMAYIVFTRRRHMRQLQRAYRHALESDRMKSAFIQNVSHEVRTPLNIISGFTQIIADPSIESSYEERQSMAEMIQKNTGIITSLVDEMLELSRSEAEGHVAKEDQVRINDLLRELLQERAMDLSPEIDLRQETTLDDAFTITTNKKVLHRLMTLLLDNAAKYTEKGHIAVKATSSDSQLQLIVEDTGCGIPASEAEHIFSRFVKLDNFKAGIGLGLTLCRTLTERLGGTVNLDTSYQGGARFIVTLPLTSSEVRFSEVRGYGGTEVRG